MVNSAFNDIFVTFYVTVCDVQRLVNNPVQNHNWWKKALLVRFNSLPGVGEGMVGALKLIHTEQQFLFFNYCTKQVFHENYCAGSLCLYVMIIPVQTFQRKTTSRQTIGKCAQNSDLSQTPPRRIKILETLSSVQSDPRAGHWVERQLEHRRRRRIGPSARGGCDHIPNPAVETNKLQY